jgi:hypothetical protein
MLMLFGRLMLAGLMMLAQLTHCRGGIWNNCGLILEKFRCCRLEGGALGFGASYRWMLSEFGQKIVPERVGGGFCQTVQPEVLTATVVPRSSLEILSRILANSR